MDPRVSPLMSCWINYSIYYPPDACLLRLILLSLAGVGVGGFHIVLSENVKPKRRIGDKMLLLTGQLTPDSTGDTKKQQKKPTKSAGRPGRPAVVAMELMQAHFCGKQFSFSFATRSRRKATEAAAGRAGFPQEFPRPTPPFPRQSPWEHNRARQTRRSDGRSRRT